MATNPGKEGVCMSNPDVLLLDRMAPGSEERDLLRRLSERGYRALIVDWDRVSFQGHPAQIFLDEHSLELPKVAVLRSRVLTRHIEGDVALLYDWLEMLERLGVTLIPSSQAIRVSQNKVYSIACLSRAGVPVPPTRTIRTMRELGQCFTDWQEVILKPIYGHASLDMVRMRAEPPDEDATDGVSRRQEIIAWHLLQRYRILCAQQFIPNPGRDLRVLVIRGQVVACFYLVAQSPTKRVKDPFSPYIREAATLTPKIESLAKRSCETLGLPCASIDMVEGPDCPVVLEVNPTISLWCPLDQEDLHLTKDGVGAAFTDMIVEELKKHSTVDALSGTRSLSSQHRL
jgi:glutathione synthase/RimK-type ligase-like ATP-grasp enzyme